MPKRGGGRMRSWKTENDHFGNYSKYTKYPLFIINSLHFYKEFRFYRVAEIANGACANEWNFFTFTFYVCRHPFILLIKK